VKIHSLKKALVLSALMIGAVSASHAAGTSSIAKQATPANVLIFSNGTGLVAGEYFGLTFSDFNGHTGNGIIDKLTTIQYSVASYAGATSDLPTLCYYTPYTSAPAQCINVAAGTSGTTTAFANFLFGPGSSVRILHKITGTPNENLQPSGPETVIYNYTY
jgi:hypothetical protein